MYAFLYDALFLVIQKGIEYMSVSHRHSQLQILFFILFLVFQIFR